MQNLLQALGDLSAAQNNFMSVWLNYYQARMELVRDIGIMQIDERGRWIERSIPEILNDLQQSLKDRGLQVEIDTKTGVLRLPDDVLFDKGQWELTERGQAAISKVASAQIN